MQWLYVVQIFVLLFRSDQEVLRWLVSPKSSTFIHILSSLMGRVRRWDLGNRCLSNLSKARSRTWTSMTSRCVSSPTPTRQTTRRGKRRATSPGTSMKRWPTSFPDGPSRFGAVATLAGPDVDGAMTEIVYALDIMKMDGVSTSTSISDVYLRQPQFDPWFEELNRRGATLFVHPTFTKASQTLLIGLNPSALEFMFDTTRMIANKVATGAKKRLSNIKIISTHGGGTVPYLVNRIQTLEHAFGVGPGRPELSPEEVRDGIASFYHDLMAATSEAQLGAILKLVPALQLVMGLNFPLMPKSTFAPAIAGIGRYPTFNKADLPSLSHGNAGRLYPALKARIERGTEHNGSGSPATAEGIQRLRRGST